MSADNLPRPLTAAWPDTQSWWDVLRAALATDLNDVHFHRRMLRQEGVTLAYGDAEAVAALRDVWTERDALQRRMDAALGYIEAYGGALPQAAHIIGRIRDLLDGEAGDE